MLAIAHRLPAEEVLEALGNVGDHFQQHDRFVEMIQVIGGKACAGIDVGVAQQLGAGGHVIGQLGV